MALNHYAINQVVKGRMSVGGRFRFGQFGAHRVVTSLLKHRPRPAARVSFNYESDRIIRDAFEKVADGTSAETVAMIDPVLAAKFHAAARRMGFHASAADMNRRLINIRKNKARYEKQGIVLPESTVVEPKPSIVPSYAHVIEFSLARLHSRYGVSIDDILLDPALAKEYEEMARTAAPNLNSRELRLAALYLRKTRYIAKQTAEVIQSLNAAKMEAAFETVGTLNDRPKVAAVEGMIELLENGKHLYISRNENLQAAVEQISSDSSLRFMANDFWQPKRESLLMRIFRGSEFLKVPISQWQLKLISDKKPVFNWPIAA